MPGVSIERKRGVLGVALDDGELDWRHVGGRGSAGCYAVRLVKGGDRHLLRW
jgi:hypothetical protein